MSLDYLITKKDIDLRLVDNRINGFHIHKSTNGYYIGKNETSIHAVFLIGRSTKQDIVDFINNNRHLK